MSAPTPPTTDDDLPLNVTTSVLVTSASIITTTSSTAPSSNTMSVAILAPVRIHTTMPAMVVPAAKRPKLSLDTISTTSTFGRSKHSNSLRLETLSATSPTMRNTWGNTSFNTSLISIDGTPGRRRIALTPKRVEHDAVDSPMAGSTSPLSPSTTLTTAPYDVSFHMSSILRNGPVRRRERRKSSVSPTGAGVKSTSPSKKVVFRAPLTEEVKNQIYTIAHSDIEPPTPTLSTLDIQEVEVAVDDGQMLQPTTYTAEPRRSRVSVAVVVESDPCPPTPVAGRSKQERQWQWTLGPIASNVTMAST